MVAGYYAARDLDAAGVPAPSALADLLLPSP
jgi:hypothetical protein